MIINPTAHFGLSQTKQRIDPGVTRERRREERVEVDCSTTLYVISEDSDSIPIRIVDISGSGMKIEMEAPLRPGILVKVNLPDSLLLGEVVWSSGESAPYCAGIRIEHSLLNLTRVRGLAMDILGGERRG
jgi:hypothetical protein